MPEGPRPPKWCLKISLSPCQPNSELMSPRMRLILIKCDSYWIVNSGVMRSNRVIGMQGPNQPFCQPFKSFPVICNFQIACVLF